MNMNELARDFITNLIYNGTWLANPEKNGVIFNYDPEAPVLDKTGKPTGKTYGKLTTTIRFKDGTVCSVSNSVHDKVNAVLISEYNGVKLPVPVLTADETSKEFGIISCLFKRMIGTIKPDGTIDGTGSGKWLKDQISKNSYDQKLMEVYGAALKKLNAQKNVEKHTAAAKKAHARAVKRFAKRLALKKEAEELLAAKKAAKTDSLKFSGGVAAKPLNESKCTCSCKTKKTRTGDSPYVRPAKRFSEFTQQEKRDYWKAQKRGWL